MPALSDKELEQRLTAAGKSLLQPPPSPDELLPLLDKIEELLSKVEQSPAKSMQASLSPLMKALVVEDLVKHSDVDVKVGVASCISEITRITAPDAPYDDDKMKAVMPIAKKLAERVIQNSADKLKPYLAQAVKSLDASVDDYGEVVASVCRETGTVGHSNESISKDQPVVERKSASASPARDPVTQARCSNDLVVAEDDIEESNLQEKDPSLIGSSKSIMSNGINEAGTEEIMAHANSSKKADSNHHVDAKSMSKTESDDCGAQNPVVLEAEAGHSEAQRVADNHETPGKDVHISPTEVKPVEAVPSLDKVEDTTTQLSPSEASENEAANSGKEEENLVREEIASADIASKKASEGKNISKAKKQRQSGKKRSDKTTDKDKALTEEGASKNDGSTSDSEARSLDQIEKLADASNKTEAESSISKEDGKQRGRVKPKFEKDSLKSSIKEVHAKDTVTSPRSPLKSMKDDGIQEETPRMSTKRKCTPGTEKVEYTDGEVEVLNLKKNGGNLLEMTWFQMGQRKKKGNAKSETSSKRQKMDSAPKRDAGELRMTNSSSHPSSKLKDSATKSGGKLKDDGKPESEAKDNNSKPSKKSVDDATKSRDNSQKLGGKSQGDSAKASGRSKDDAAKTPSHSKQDSQKSAQSKGKTPQSGKTHKSGKTLSAGGSRMTKTSSSKVKESDRKKEKLADLIKSSETAKGKPTDTAKSRESGSKSGKKRRR
ncbi:hypothetical protein DH2020_025436 [Rehmannia glutinosa]|uniref:Uncharacterized protein n=1 Tax=Rehmannia glutinosa TaxID=99300 RepID=A0ABR0W3B4_REHGL